MCSMYLQLAATRIPVEHIIHRQIRILFEQGASTMLLRNFKSFVGIDLQVNQIERTCEGITGAEAVFGSRIDAALGRVRTSNTRPHVGLL